MDWTKREWVLTARDGRDALSVAGHSDAPIQVLVTDIVMPHVRGPELAKRLKAPSPDHPELQVVAPRAPP